MEAPRTIRAGTIGAHWYFVALVRAAIAISYFDRQTLPVAISAIEQGYFAQQPAVLVAAVCVSDSVCPVVCRRRPVAGRLGYAKRIPPDHAVVVGVLRSA